MVAFLFAFALFSLKVACSNAVRDRRNYYETKNILFILADQLRADFCGCYGANWLKTPNIDKLATDGMLYRQVISLSPLCVPARASLLMGKSAIENRVTNNWYWLRPDYDAMGVTTWPQQLTESGYH